MNRDPRQDTLIDFSPATSGTSTPVNSQSASSSTYLGSAISTLWRRISATDTTTHTSAYSTSPSSSYVHSSRSPPPSLHGSMTFPSNHPSSFSASSAGGTMGGGGGIFGIGAGPQPGGFGGPVGDGIHGAYTPPRRAISPRMLPSLEPVVLAGYREDTRAEERLLSRGMAEEIRTFLPERLKIGDEWRLVYSLYQDGSSLATLYKLAEEYRGRRVGFVLVVRDGLGGTFGAYLTEYPHPSASYYGTGECFLWRASIHVPLPPPPSADTEDLLSATRTTTIADASSPTFPTDHLSATTAAVSHNKPYQQQQLLPEVAAQQQHSLRFQAFAYTGLNDYCVYCEPKYLSLGGGGGGGGSGNGVGAAGSSGAGTYYGLWLDDAFARGHSGSCDTFGNAPLSDEGVKFDVLGVELWVVGAG